MSYLIAQFGIVFSCCEPMCCHQFCQVHFSFSAAFVCLFFSCCCCFFFPSWCFLFLPVSTRACQTHWLCSSPFVFRLVPGVRPFCRLGVAFVLRCLGTQFPKSVCPSRLFTKSKFFFILLSVLIQGLSRKLKAGAIKETLLYPWLLLLVLYP